MSELQNVGQVQSPVCKHHQRGYCRNGSQCSRTHNDNICKEIVCQNPECRERHPKICKYYIRNGECWWKEECAYKHKRSDSNIKIDILERKEKSKSLKMTLNSFVKKMSEIMIKIISLEERDKQYFSETQNGASTNGQPNVGLKNKEVFKCDQCDHYFDAKMELKTHVDTKHEEPDFFQCKICKSCFHSKIQLQKHTNTKHLSRD